MEVDAEPGAARRVARALARFPWAVNVKETAGGRDLVVNAQGQDPQRLWHYIATGLSVVDGVTATRTHLVTALTDEVDARMTTLLNEDGRMSIRELAEHTGLSVTTTGRRLRQLLASRVNLRCDVARPLSGWPLAAVYFASAPAEKLREIVQVLGAVPEVRLCAIVSGPHNLVVDVWLRTLPDVHAIEAHLSARLPPLKIHDRSVVVRTTKHMGRLLADDGRCEGVVPINPWNFTDVH